MKNEVDFYNRRVKIVNVVLCLSIFLMCMVFCFEVYFYNEDHSECVLVVTDKNNVVTCYLVYSNTIFNDENTLSFTTKYGENVYLYDVSDFHECECSLEN